MSLVQTAAERMMADRGFLGVPTPTFESGGRDQFLALLRQGLLPESRVLDIGCGVLRTGYWLIRFLNAGCYFGIEPARARVEAGMEYLFSPEILGAKRPSFTYNAEFDPAAFGARFDYFLAGSIWTHASRRQIGMTLDAFKRYAESTGVFMATCLPPTEEEPAYLGDEWVGTSHVSTAPGIARHPLSWLNDQCAQRGLQLSDEVGSSFDSQYWLRITHA